MCIISSISNCIFTKISHSQISLRNPRQSIHRSDFYTLLCPTFVHRHCVAAHHRHSPSPLTIATHLRRSPSPVHHLHSPLLLTVAAHCRRSPSSLTIVAHLHGSPSHLTVTVHCHRPRQHTLPIIVNKAENYSFSLVMIRW